MGDVPMVKGMRIAGSNGGFTLIELVVVVAIIAVLAGILVPMVSHEVDDARGSRAMTDMKTLGNAFTTYRTHTGIWPSNAAVSGLAGFTNMSEECAAFTCLFSNVHSAPGWNGPYLNNGFKVGSAWTVAGTNPGEGLLDPWGRRYNVFWYKQNNAQIGEGGGIVLVCAGPNGVVNTTRAKAANGEEQGDDLVFVVTRRL